jgi:hypothetical protein
MSIGLLVTDNSEAPFPKFFNYYKASAYMQYSPFLSFEFKSDIDGKVKVGKKAEGDIYENCTFSVMDMRKLKDAFQEVDDIVSSDYYAWEDHIDRGQIPRVKPEYKEYKVIVTNSSQKGQIALLLCFTYNRKQDIYTPCVKILINSDGCAINVPIEHFLAISLFIKEMNLHSAARETISAFLTNHHLRKANIAASAKQVEIEEEET